MAVAHRLPQHPSLTLSAKKGVEDNRNGLALHRTDDIDLSYLDFIILHLIAPSSRSPTPSQVSPDSSTLGLLVHLPQSVRWPNLGTWLWSWGDTSMNTMAS